MRERSVVASWWMRFLHSTAFLINMLTFSMLLGIWFVDSNPLRVPQSALPILYTGLLALYLVGILMLTLRAISGLPSTPVWAHHLLIASVLWIAAWFEFMVFAMNAPTLGLPWLEGTVLAFVCLGALTASIGALTLTLANM